MSQLRDSASAAPTITITVTFFADLRRFLPRGADGPQRYAVPEGATVAALLAAIGIEADSEVTVAVDGELADRDTKLRDGVEVMLLNPMEGGAAAAGEATILKAGGAAAAGEATILKAGGAAAAGEATTLKAGGAAAAGEATTLTEGGKRFYGPLRILEQDPAR
jgi:sulfur carrier protein ThiS